MATTANSNSSPSLSAAAATSSPAWTQIVRGPEPDLIGAPTPPSVSGDRTASPPLPAAAATTEIMVENSDNGGKKPAWNKKITNVPVENGGPGPVMGPAEAWPALSESTKASPKASSSDSTKISSDSGSVSSPLVIGGESSSLSVASSVQPQFQSSSTSPKPTISNLNHNPMSNQGRTTRQKSMKRDGGSNPQTNGGVSHQPSSPSEGSHNYNQSSTKPSTGGSFESSARESIQNHVHRESGSRNASGDHPQPRNSFRKGGGGSHSRGDGSHQNYGGRRGDQDRGNHEWNHQRSFNGRDSTMQQRVSPRSFRPPPVTAPFVHPPPMRPFINPMGVAEVPMYYLPAMPFVQPVPGHMFMQPVPDPQKIVTQIDYYFSNENLIRDTYLRQNMDENGWVPVSLVASFKKVNELTQNIQLILDAVRSSTNVEVQGDKIRKRDDWRRWLMPPSVHFPTASQVPQSPNSATIAALSFNIQNVKLDEKVVDQNHAKGQLDVDAATILRASSGDLNSPLQTCKAGSSSTSH